MPDNYTTDDPILGTIDLDDKFVTDAWLVDQFVGNQLWAWGHNGSGALGLNDTIWRSSPVQVGSLTNWKQVSYGIFSSLTGVTGIQSYGLATKTDGTLWAWGYNLFGPLGLNDITNRSSPVQVGTLTNWKQVSTNWRPSTYNHKQPASS